MKALIQRKIGPRTWIALLIILGITAVIVMIGWILVPIPAISMTILYTAYEDDSDYIVGYCQILGVSAYWTRCWDNNIYSASYGCWQGFYMVNVFASDPRLYPGEVLLGQTNLTCTDCTTDDSNPSGLELSMIVMDPIGSVRECFYHPGDLDDGAKTTRPTEPGPYQSAMIALWVVFVVFVCLVPLLGGGSAVGTFFYCLLRPENLLRYHNTPEDL